MRTFERVTAVLMALLIPAEFIGVAAMESNAGSWSVWLTVLATIGIAALMIAVKVEAKLR